MKVVEINSVCGIRSTGRICTDIADMLQENGDECRIGYGRSEVPSRYRPIAVPIGNKNSLLIHGIGSRLFDNTGFYSKAATRRFLKWLDAYQPDLIHLHNIHGYYLNIEILFRYLKEKKIPVVWTLHDCWPCTGHCSHFAATGCQKWQVECHDCVLRREYPTSMLVDNSRKNYRRKKAMFCGVEKLRIVTPSNWLTGCVSQSFLGGYPIQTIPNGVDLSVFHPTESDFIQKYHLENKKVILGVASAWSNHKGLDAFYRLAQILDEAYQVVLVGLTEQQIRNLPGNILGIRRTNSIEELAQIYTAAYVHVSMSVEETMGMTVIEANACGTPVIVFDCTALPEIVTAETGVVLRSCTPETVAKTIVGTDFSKDRFSAACIAHAWRFEKKKMYSQYIELYRSMVT